MSTSFSGIVIPLDTSEIFTEMMGYFGWIAEKTDETADLWDDVMIDLRHPKEELYVAFSRKGTLIMGNFELLNQSNWPFKYVQTCRFLYEDTGMEFSLDLRYNINQVRFVHVVDGEILDEAGEATSHESENDGDLSGAIPDIIQDFTGINTFGDDVAMQIYKIKWHDDFTSEDMPEIRNYITESKTWFLNWESSQHFVRFAGRTLDFNDENKFNDVCLSFGWVLNDTRTTVDMRKHAMNPYQKNESLFVFFSELGILMLGNYKTFIGKAWELINRQITTFAFDDQYCDRHFSHAMTINEQRRITISGGAIQKEMGQESYFEIRNNGDISKAIIDAIFTFSGIDILGSKQVLMKKYEMKTIDSYPSNEQAALKELQKSSLNRMTAWLNVRD